MDAIGVTRVGEVTYLDRNGVPGFVAVRPRDKDPGISYYNGKGCTKAQARASAMMEAVERYSGEKCSLPSCVATVSACREVAAIVEPLELTAPLLYDVNDASAIEWVAGYDLIQRRPVLVPMNSVVCPYESAAARPFAFSSTNGLASGNSRSEAVSHALCEINERDAMALASTGAGLLQAIDEITSFGHVSTVSSDTKSFPEISHAGLPRRAARVLGKLKSVGLTVYLRDITSDTGIPTIDCTVVESIGSDFTAHAGFGSHPDRRVALLRALTEAAQSRVACIQGGREDLPEFADKSLNIGDPDQAFRGSHTVYFSDLTSFQFSTVREDIEFMLQRFALAELDAVVAVDLTDSELGIPVVRLVVPSAETWSVFHLHTGRGRFGKRVLRMLRGI